MAQSPFEVELGSIRNSLGLQRSFELCCYRLEGFVLAGSEIEAETLDVKVELEMRGQDLFVTGELGVSWAGPCRRCLEPAKGHVDWRIREIFQDRPAEGETYHLGEDRVDLEPMVRESVLLNLPMTPLCSAECDGPDPDRFPTVGRLASDSPRPTPDPEMASESGDEVAELVVLADPRWAPLSQLRFPDD